MLQGLFRKEEQQVVKEVPIAALGMWQASPKPIGFSATDLQQMCDNLNHGIPPVVPQSFGHNTDPTFIGRMMEAYGIMNESPFVGRFQGSGGYGSWPVGKWSGGRRENGGGHNWSAQHLGQPDESQ